MKGSLGIILFVIVVIPLAIVIYKELIRYLRKK